MTKNLKHDDPQEPDVRIVEPDFSLKKKIGEHVNIAEIFSPERVADAQQVIDNGQAQFLQWVTIDLKELDKHFNELYLMPNAESAAHERIRKTAFAIKCHAGTFGFNLGSEVARGLHNFLAHHKEYSEEQLAVVQKHIESLKAILMNNIQGDGGKMGEELTESLKKLVEKYN